MDREPLGHARGLRQRSRVRLHPPREWRRSRAGRGRRCARQGGPSGGAHFVGGSSTTWARRCSAGRFATAVAGSVLGINAFNQPDVEASKIATKKLTSEYEKTGSLPAETPILTEGGIELFTDDKNAAALASAAGSDKTLAGYLRAHLSRFKAGDYFAPAGLRRNERSRTSRSCRRCARRCAIRSASPLVWASARASCTRPGRPTRAAPTPACSCRSPAMTPSDLPVPGQKYTFGVVKAAQARGDFQVLAERNRRALRVHLHDVEKGLADLLRTLRLRASGARTRACRVHTRANA